MVLGHFLHSFHGLHWLHFLHRLLGLHGFHGLHGCTTRRATRLEARWLQSSNGLDFGGPDSWIVVEFSKGGGATRFLSFNGFSMIFEGRRCYPSCLFYWMFVDVR